MTYPHGRPVQYTYSFANGADRVSNVAFKLWNGSAWSSTWTNVAEDVRWEPYGAVRAYRIPNGAGTSDDQWVEYFLGQGEEIAPSATACASLAVPSGSLHDESGRLRGVFVSDSAGVPGAPNGNVFKQIYTWSGDQLVRDSTCYGNVGSVANQIYTYDSMKRLLSRTDNVPAVSETFAYDRRGNRTARTLGGPACTHQIYPWSLPHQTDLHLATRWGTAYGTACNGAEGAYYWDYDRDGRAVRKWDASNQYSIDLGYAQFGSYFAGIDSVFQSALITGGNSAGGSYSYFYDALGRRRAKMTPWSSTEEYFYDTGHQLLADRGGNTIGSTPTQWPEDDYLWLDGRPIHIIRSRFDPTTFVRTEGNTNWCTRNGVQQVCASWSVITDYLGKPVLTFDRGGIAGTGFAEAFGSQSS